MVKAGNRTNELQLGSRGGPVVRALTAHQCGPGLIPGLGVVCGLSLLLVLFLATMRQFFSGNSGFPLSQVNTSELCAGKLVCTYDTTSHMVMTKTCYHFLFSYLHFFLNLMTYIVRILLLPL